MVGEYVSVAERRARPERRRRPAWMSWRFFYGGRRRGPRRLEDDWGSYADVYDWRISVTVVGLVVLGICDAAFTLVLLNAGAEELNPVMASALAVSERHFVHVKLALTLPGVVVLAVHQHFPLFGRLKVRDAAALLLGTYGLLVSYEILMLKGVL